MSGQSLTTCPLGVVFQDALANANTYAYVERKEACSYFDMDITNLFLRIDDANRRHAIALQSNHPASLMTVTCMFLSFMGNLLQRKRI